MPESGCWALELAQGWVPPMLPFGMADSLFSTLDLRTFGRTCVITAREMILNLLRGMYFAQMYRFVSDSILQASFEWGYDYPYTACRLFSRIRFP